MVQGTKRSGTGYCTEPSHTTVGLAWVSGDIGLPGTAPMTLRSVTKTTGGKWTSPARWHRGDRYGRRPGRSGDGPLLRRANYHRAWVGPGLPRDGSAAGRRTTPLSRLYRTMRPPTISDTADQQADGNDSETVRPLTSFSTEPPGEGRAA